MHALFAIEPAAINNWHDLRYTLEKFGYSKGLLIASFPKSWMRLVMEACRQNGLGDIELKRIEEKLRQAKEDRVVRMGLPFPDDNWLESIKKETIRESLTAVLIRDKSDTEGFHCLAEVDEALFENRRDVQVKRTAKDLAEAARFVLLSSDRLVMVDPYFQAKSKCCKVLEAMTDVCREKKHRLVEIKIFCARRSDPRQVDLITADYERLLANVLEQDVHVRVYFLSDERLDFDFHARYLFSSHAGLRFDRGFVEPVDLNEREHMTDVACMDERMVTDLGVRFLEFETNQVSTERIGLRFNR